MNITAIINQYKSLSKAAVWVLTFSSLRVYMTYYIKMLKKVASPYVCVFSDIRVFKADGQLCRIGRIGIEQESVNFKALSFYAIGYAIPA